MTTLCNLCGKNNATIYFKGLVNNQTLKMHLCEACAKKKGMSFPFGKTASTLEEMVSALLDGIPLLGSEQSQAVCPTCGLSFAEFQQTSLLGCSQCYSTFASILGPLLQRIHGSAQHMGKTYNRTVRTLSSTQELARFKLELSEAIKKENFEQAAALRDEIQKLEQQMTTPRKNT